MVTVSRYFDRFSWDLDKGISGKGHNILGPSEIIDLKWSKYAQLVTVFTFFDGFTWDLDKSMWE